MATLLEQLQEDALDHGIPVSTLLRKVKLAAAKLKLERVEGWVQSELAGYDDEPPEYRKIVGEPKAFNPYNGWIPLYGNAEIVNIISRFELHQSVSEIESLLGRDGTLYLPFGPVQVNTINQMMKVPFAQMGLFIDQAVLVQILNRVRNAVLDWAVDLEKAGVVGAGMSFSDDEKRRASQVSINIGTFQGNLSAGDVSGAGARVVQRSVGNSQLAGANAFSFDSLRTAIEDAVEEGVQKGRLLQLVGELESSQGKPSFSNSYKKFVAEAAQYMTIVGPFIPALTAMLGGPGS